MNAIKNGVDVEVIKKLIDQQSKYVDIKHGLIFTPIEILSTKYDTKLICQSDYGYQFDYSIGAPKSEWGVSKINVVGGSLYNEECDETPPPTQRRKKVIECGHLF